VTVVVSGFEPFDGAVTNPSWEAAARLAERGEELAGDRVAAVRLPVTFAEAWPVLGAAIREHEPDVVVALGLAGGAPGVRLERVAVNVRDARIPDNAGDRPVDVPVVEGGPVGYWSTLPLKASLATIRATGVPVAVSSTAGTYVCNDVFYALMHHWGAGPGRRAGFVHVPGTDVVPIEDQVAAVAAVVRHALLGTPDPVLAGGTES
jgi:pyroglutamyl-peptidase